MTNSTPTLLLCKHRIVGGLHFLQLSLSEKGVCLKGRTVACVMLIKTLLPLPIFASAFHWLIKPTTPKATLISEFEVLKKKAEEDQNRALRNKKNLQLIAQAEKSSQELFHKAQQCVYVTEEGKKTLGDTLRNLFLINYYRKYQLKLNPPKRGDFFNSDCAYNYLHENILNKNYRTLGQESNRLLSLFPGARHCSNLAIKPDSEGWTESMREAANKNSTTLQAFLTTRADDFNTHVQVPKKPITTVCFLIRSPFSLPQRLITQKATLLLPFISMYYLHSSTQSPMALIPITLGNRDLNAFIAEHNIQRNQNVEILREGLACAFIEYIIDVSLAKESSLKITSITSNLEAFYANHDAYLQSIQKNIRQTIQAYVSDNPLSIMYEYLENEHPLPVENKAH